MTRRSALALAVLAAVAAPLGTGCGPRGSERSMGRKPMLARSSLSRSDGDADAIPGVVAALHDLAGGVYGRLAAQPGNLVLSPYSAASALAMTLPGARGRTAAEMREVLGVTDEARYHRGLNALTAYVDGLAGSQRRADGSEAELALHTANQLFGQEGVHWERDFLDLLAREYGAGLRAVDFRSAPERARMLINDWVASRTHDRIPELVPSGVLDQLTRLVLVNALYLEAPWEIPFEKPLTERAAFHRGDGRRLDVDTMVQPILATTATSGEGWRAARLPYAGRALAMTVILPDPGRMPDVEQQAASGRLWAEATSTGERTTLDLRLPRWTFRTQAPLDEVLTQLGMPTALDPERADFRSMTEEDLHLFIETVLHEAYVAVDEAGTEAAAATAVVMSRVSAPVTEPFHVDRPFLFAVHDAQHATPLLLGRVDDPSG